MLDVQAMNTVVSGWFLMASGTPEFFPILLIPLFLVLAGCGIFWHFSRSRSILEKWAEENGYLLLESDYRNIFKGPFFLTSSRQQTVYHVKVRDEAGNVRSGWVRCGGWFMGLWSEKADVRWEE
jgi:hypothetical protein